MGVENISETLIKLQSILGDTYVISQDNLDKVIEKYRGMNIKLYSYSSNLSKELIIRYQDDLDWLVLQRNPYVQWDLELINIFLRKYKKLVSEKEWNGNLNGSHAMYIAFQNLVNDQVLSDIEKLYEL